MLYEFFFSSFSVANVSNMLNDVITSDQVVRVLIENSAGQGNSVGKTLDYSHDLESFQLLPNQLRNFNIFSIVDWRSSGGSLPWV